MECLRQLNVVNGWSQLRLCRTCAHEGGKSADEHTQRKAYHFEHAEMLLKAVSNCPCRSSMKRFRRQRVDRLIWIQPQLPSPMSSSHGCRRLLERGLRPLWVLRLVLWGQRRPPETLTLNPTLRQPPVSIRGVVSITLVRNSIG